MLNGVTMKINVDEYILHTLKPNQMLMVNDFGQIVSLNIDPQKLKDILTKYDQIMSL